MRLPWSAPRPTWHYRFRSGVESDYPIVEDHSRPVTMPDLDLADLETIELRLGDNMLAYATLQLPARVGVCTAGAVFDVPAGAQLYHALCRVKHVNEQRRTRAPELLPNTGFVLGWRTKQLQRRMEVWIDHTSMRVDIKPGSVEPVASAWVEAD